MSKDVAISWKVPNGNPDHEIPKGAIVTFKAEDQILCIKIVDGKIKINTSSCGSTEIKN